MAQPASIYSWTVLPILQAALAQRRLTAFKKIVVTRRTTPPIAGSHKVPVLAVQVRVTKLQASIQPEFLHARADLISMT